jgi:hypothetical protein
MVGIRANAPTWGIWKKTLAAFVYSPVGRRISSIGRLELGAKESGIKGSCFLLDNSWLESCVKK